MSVAKKSGVPFWRLLGVAFGGILLSCQAHAQGADTVERIMKTHVINLGVRDLSPPFSTLDKGGKAVGYSIDICYKLVEQMRKDLKLSDLKAQEVVVTASNRLDKIKDGTIDLECGSTVITKPRLKDVDFSYAVLFGAQRFLTTPAAGIDSQVNLAGKTVAVVKGSTGEKILDALKAGEVPTVKILSVANNDEALAALESGRAQAISQMDVILQFVRLKSKNPEHLIVTQWPLTVEPIGFPVRKGDPRFLNLVNESLRTLFGQTEFRALYDKWFYQQVKMAPSALMMENMHRPSSSPGMSFVGGVEL